MSIPYRQIWEDNIFLHPKVCYKEKCIKDWDVLKSHSEEESQ